MEHPLLRPHIHRDTDTHNPTTLPHPYPKKKTKLITCCVGIDLESKCNLNLMG
jgi:hypothetical protein